MLKLAIGVSQLDHGRFQQMALLERIFVGILPASSFLIRSCPPNISKSKDKFEHGGFPRKRPFSNCL